MPRARYVCDRNAIREHYGGALPVFRGVSVQQGYGIGNLISGLFRQAVPLLSKTILPVLKSTAKRAGKTLLRSSANVMKDVILDKKDLKQSMKRHAKSSLDEILDNIGNQKGRGFNLTCKKKRRKSPVKLKYKKKDIFD